MFSEELKVGKQPVENKIFLISKAELEGYKSLNLGLMCPEGQRE